MTWGQAAVLSEEEVKSRQFGIFLFPDIQRGTPSAGTFCRPLGVREKKFSSSLKVSLQCSAGGLERTLELQEQCRSASEIGIAAAFSPAIFQEVFTNSWVLLKQIVWFLAVYFERPICFMAQKHLWTMMFLCQHVLEEAILSAEVAGVRIQIRALSTSLFLVKDFFFLIRHVDTFSLCGIKSTLGSCTEFCFINLWECRFSPLLSTPVILPLWNGNNKPCLPPEGAGN